MFSVASGGFKFKYVKKMLFSERFSFATLIFFHVVLMVLFIWYGDVFSHRCQSHRKLNPSSSFNDGVIHDDSNFSLSSLHEATSNAEMLLERQVQELLRQFDCQHFYIDMGTNIGVQIRKLYEPDKYPKAEVLSIFESVFGRDKCKVC